MRISVDGSRIRNNKVAFSNLSGIVWTGPKLQFSLSSYTHGTDLAIVSECYVCTAVRDVSLNFVSETSTFPNRTKISSSQSSEQNKGCCRKIFIGSLEFFRENARFLSILIN